ncbi:casein kinase II subunit beta [Batrachochytrium salamandrivorans]|nr:casein kinase II subunit beta [Batrachochytrium salamandrivorans]
MTAPGPGPVDRLICLHQRSLGLIGIVRSQHEFFLEIPEQYIEDEFNLVGLSNIVPLYSEALDLILDLELDCSDTDDSTGIRPTQQQQQYNAHVRIVESSAQTLYGLIHARFLLTKPALVNMAKRFEMRDFGRCPRIGCGGCGVIPCGLSDLPGVATLSVRTSVAALQKSSERPDAAMRERAALARAREHPVLSSDENNEEAGSNDTDSDSNDDIYSDDEEDGGEEGHGKEWVSSLNSLSDYWRYTPTIFGFRVSERSPHGPRMGWLRWRSDMSGCDRPGCGESVFRAITRRRDLPDACNGVATATTLSTRAEKDKILDSYGMDVSMKSIGSVGFTGSMECISREGSIAGDFSMRAGQNVDGHMDDIETATADG